MSIFDMAAPQLHHGQPLSVRSERLIDPTDEEARMNGVLEVGISLAWCQKEECRKDFVFVRHRYPGGWGPVHKVHDARQKAEYRKRCKLSRESDWVNGWNHKYHIPARVPVM